MDFIHGDVRYFVAMCQKKKRCTELCSIQTRWSDKPWHVYHPFLFQHCLIIWQFRFSSLFLVSFFFQINFQQNKIHYSDSKGWKAGTVFIAPLWISSWKLSWQFVPLLVHYNFLSGRKWLFWNTVKMKLSWFQHHAPMATQPWTSTATATAIVLPTLTVPMVKSAASPATATATASVPLCMTMAMAIITLMLANRTVSVRNCWASAQWGRMGNMILVAWRLKRLFTVGWLLWCVSVWTGKLVRMNKIY